MVSPALQPTPAAAPADAPSAPAPSSDPVACCPPPVASLPPLSPRQTHLLNAYLASRCNLFRFAQDEKLSALDLNEWFASEAVQAHLTNLKSLADFGLALRTTQLRLEALEDLHTISKTTEDPIEKRRAASAILRGSRLLPSSPNGGGAAALGGGGGSVSRDLPTASTSSASAPLTDHRSPHPPPHTDPNTPPPHFTPEQTSRYVLAGIPFTCPDDPLIQLSQSYHAPRPQPFVQDIAVADDVAHALKYPRDPNAFVSPFRQLHEQATCNTKPIPREIYAYAEFFNEHLAHDEEIVRADVRFACDDRLSPHHSGFRITLIPKSGRPFEYYLALQRGDYGPHPKCWLITRLDRVTLPGKPAPPAVPPTAVPGEALSVPDSPDPQSTDLTAHPSPLTAHPSGP